ncbi:MAG: hypothetical protein GKS06_19935 [Acidobacteria bacterium]|nr:hypothetical protein [Acidobacteriota bacterium]
MHTHPTVGRYSSRGIAVFVACLMFASAPVALAQQTGTPAEPAVSTLPVDIELTSWGRLGGITVDALGYIYTTAFGDTLWRIYPDGEGEVLADGFYGASGNAIDINGDVLQSEFFTNSIYRVTRSGDKSLVTNEGLNGPVAIAVDAEGVMFVANCNDGSVVRVERDGTASTFSRSELYNCPNGIIFDDQGDLYMVNFQNDHLVKVDAEGNASIHTTIEPAGGWPQSALDRNVRGNAHLVFVNGNFYVTKIKSHSLWRVGRDDGSVEMITGNYQYGLVDGPLAEASLGAPNGIAANRGVLYMNNIDGIWGRLARARLVIRKVTLPQ